VSIVRAAKAKPAASFIVRMTFSIDGMRQSGARDINGDERGGVRAPDRGTVVSTRGPEMERESASGIAA
jgi:hypothetical protein